MSDGMARVIGRHQLAELAAELGLNGWDDWDEAEERGVTASVDGEDVGSAFPDDNEREARLEFWKDGEGVGTVSIADLLAWAATPPRSVTFDLSDPAASFTLITALEEFAARQRAEAKDEGGHESRERWADLADQMRAQAEAAG